MVNEKEFLRERQVLQYIDVPASAQIVAGNPAGFRIKSPEFRIGIFRGEICKLRRMRIGVIGWIQKPVVAQQEQGEKFELACRRFRQQFQQRIEDTGQTVGHLSPREIPVRQRMEFRTA